MNKTVKLFDLKLVLNFYIGTTKKLCSNTELFQRCYLWRWRKGTQSDTKLAFFLLQSSYLREKSVHCVTVTSPTAWLDEVGVALRTFRRSVYSVYSAYWCVPNRKVKTQIQNIHLWTAFKQAGIFESLAPEL